ncbi:MAG: ribosome-associated translation inhibitor RaiA [Eubacteriales bacterium]|nr:ribosome-associated translation inhibitor RaiA [Eubacteriales bacterium]
MNITYIGRQVTVYDDMKQMVEKKLAKFDRYFPENADAAVTFRKIRDMECMEITISVGSTLFRAEEQADKYATALVRCVDTIEGQIRKNKTRLAKRMRTAFVSPDPAPGEAPDPADDAPFRIRTKRFALRPMTAEEAILQMNLLNHTFYMFLNADTNETCVVYKRDDGDYGIIAPDKQL